MFLVLRDAPLKGGLQFELFSTDDEAVAWNNAKLLATSGDIYICEVIGKMSVYVYKET